LIKNIITIFHFAKVILLLTFSTCNPHNLFGIGN
jgi:hypothetical protein